MTHKGLRGIKSDGYPLDSVFTGDHDVFNLLVYQECTIARTPQILLT